MEPFTERGLLTAEGKEIKAKEILQLLEAVWKPCQVTVIHCKGHQRGTDAISKGNWLADQAARGGSNPRPQSRPQVSFEVLLAPELPPSPRYTKEDQQALNEGGMKGKEGWWKLSQTKDSPSPAI